MFLSPEAITFWKEKVSEPSLNRMCIRHPFEHQPSIEIINTLNDRYFPLEHIEETYFRYKNKVCDSLTIFKDDEKIRKKWEWFGQYLKAETSQDQSKQWLGVT